MCLPVADCLPIKAAFPPEAAARIIETQDIDPDHGVLPLPVATWVLPVNPLIFTHVSVCLAACLLLSLLSSPVPELARLSLRDRLHHLRPPITTSDKSNKTFAAGVLESLEL